MDVQLSKNLSWLLRHGGRRENLNIHPDGYADIDEVVRHPSIRLRGSTAADIFRVVENDAKGRYAIRRCETTGRVFIKATQGHSMDVSELSLREVSSAAELPLVIHGTYLRCWERIKCEGLKRMKRIHIHFTASPINLSTQVVSGFRSNCEVLIYVDADKAMQAGIKFFRSENNVILSPGLGDGIVSPEFFKKVVNRRTGEVLFASANC